MAGGEQGRREMNKEERECEDEVPSASLLACRRINAPAEQAASILVYHWSDLQFQHNFVVSLWSTQWHSPRHINPPMALCAPPKPPQKGGNQTNSAPSSRVLAGHFSCSRGLVAFYPARGRLHQWQFLDTRRQVVMQNYGPTDAQGPLILRSALQASSFCRS